MNVLYCAILTVGLISAPNSAWARNITLDRKGEKGVVVWKHKSAAREGNVLRQSGAGIELLAPLVACIVAPRTSAILIRDEGYFKTIAVSAGDHTGCRGVISPGDIAE